MLTRRGTASTTTHYVNDTCCTTSSASGHSPPSHPSRRCLTSRQPPFLIATPWGHSTPSPSHSSSSSATSCLLTSCAHHCLRVSMSAASLAFRTGSTCATGAAKIGTCHPWGSPPRWPLSTCAPVRCSSALWRPCHNVSRLSALTATRSADISLSRLQDKPCICYTSLQDRDLPPLRICHLEGTCTHVQ